MLLLIVLALVAFVREAFPMGVTATGMMASIYLLGFVNTQELFSGVTNRAVITIGALRQLHLGLSRERAKSVQGGRDRRMARSQGAGLSEDLRVVEEADFLMQPARDFEPD